MNRLSPLRFLFVWFCIGVPSWQPGFCESPPSGTSRPAKEVLEAFNGLVGEWRGIGQVRRGSAQGAWREKGEFVWDFSQEEPAVRYVVDEGKHVAEGRITWNPAAKEFQLRLTTPEGVERTCSGSWKENQVAFVSPPDENGEQYRLTITALNEKRTLVLHEKTTPAGSLFFRVAEVGYTRAGTRLAGAGGGQRECVVTGGAASTEVRHNGETYYVCCSGCKQAFEDDPEGILAEFRERLQRERQKRDER